MTEFKPQKYPSRPLSVRDIVEITGLVLGGLALTVGLCLGIMLAVAAVS